MTPQELPEKVLAFITKHGGWSNALEYVAGLEAALAGAGAVAYITPSALDALNKCRNDDHNGVVDVWMRPFDELGATIPLFTHPAPVAVGVDEAILRYQFDGLRRELRDGNLMVSVESVSGAIESALEAAIRGDTR